jgi:hypothetical protein
MSKDLFLSLIRDNEQDRAEMRAWWKETSLENKLRVWERIQVVHEDPIDEIISRFAQLAFAEATEKYEFQEPIE